MSSVPLEAAHQLPIGHPAVVFQLLPAAGVHVVVHDLVPERLTQELRLVEALDCLAQCLRNLGNSFAYVGITRERRFELELLVNASKTGSYQRCKREIWIEVRAA